LLSIRAKSKAIIIVILTSIITTIFVLYTKETNHNLLNIKSTWNNYQLNTLTTSETLTKLQAQTGYGGFFYNIQQYKNTKNPNLVPRLIKQSQLIKKILADYAIFEINQEEKAALKQLNTTIDKYLTQINQNAFTPHEINDSSAISALNLLIATSLARNKSEQQHATNALGHALKVVVWANLLVPAAVILSIIFMALMLANLAAKKRYDTNTKNLHSLIEANPDAMVAVTLGGLITHCNHQTELLFHTHRNKLINTPIQSLITLKIDLHAQRSVNLKTPYESYAIISQEQQTPIEIGMNLAQLNNEEVFIFTLRDITHRKNIEYTLLHNESRIRSILESVGEGVIGVNKTGICTFINPAALKLLNYQSSSQIVGENVHALIHSSTNKQSACNPSSCDLNAAILGGNPLIKNNETLLRSDHKNFNAEVRSYPLIENDTLMGAVITFCDTTEKNNHEERLRQTAMVFNATKDGIIITNNQKRIIATNHAFTELSGYSEEYAIGKHAHFHKYEDQRTESLKKIENTLHKHGHWQGEVWNRRQDSEIYPAWEDISCVKNANGETTNYTVVFSDISAIKESEQRLNHLAHHDILTGLPNRLLFSVNLTQTLERAKRHTQQVGLLFIDLDRFKIINDTLGHAAGDTLLETIASRLKESVRAEDTVARFGGDEFTIILSQIKHPEDASLLAQKINTLLSDSVTVEDQEVVVTASIGISIFPDDALSGENLAKAADAAMYRAKENGRNTYQFYSADLADMAMEHLSLEQGLRQAITRNEFVLHYQPQFSLKKNCLIGVEALIRWQHPQLGLIPPDKFIHIAEEAGLIETIGRWVLSSVCEQIKTWRQQGLPIFRVSINVSGRELMNQNTLVVFKDIIQRAQLETKDLHLELEITEGVLRDAERSLKTLNELKSLGVSLAIDDFGTGYSSLSRLKHLPIDTLKIDRSFVKDLPDNQDDGAITCAVIALGQSLNLRVIAEGAETQDQIRFLRDRGCDEIQGFLLGRPVPACEIAGITHTPPAPLSIH